MTNNGPFVFKTRYDARYKTLKFYMFKDLEEKPINLSFAIL